jgi:ArsR family transcriptional regulator
MARHWRAIDFYGTASHLYRNQTINLAGPMHDDDIATIMRALGHPVRLSILRILAKQRECCCADVTEEIPLAQSTVSQHIKVLLDAGLIVRMPKGTRNCYVVQHDRLAELGAAYSGIVAGLVTPAATQEAEPA